MDIYEGIKIGDRVRVLHNGPLSKPNIYGEVIHIDPDGSALVNHDTYHMRMHNGGDRCRDGHGWWYYQQGDLEKIAMISISPEADFESVL